MLNDYLQNLIDELKIPYLDVVCCRSHEKVCRFVLGDGIVGKEKFYAYSCGKVITVVSALKLIEDGKMGLSDRVCDYLPSAKNAFIINDKGERVMVGDKITLRHLFTMSAGLTYDLTTKPILDLVNKSGGKAILQDFIPKFFETPLAFTPGERFNYSLCHDVLAGVVEVVSGMKFSRYVKQTIFDPLGMNNSFFDNSEKGVLDVYFAHENGEIKKIDEGKILLPTPSYESGGAGLVTTVEDYIRFADALACEGRSDKDYCLLKPQTIKLLTTAQFERASVNNGYTCVQGDDYGYGLGVRVRQKSTDWGLNKGEFGWDGAAGAYVLIDPERHVSVFIGMHVRNWPVVFAGKHLEIVKAIYQKYILSNQDKI